MHHLRNLSTITNIKYLLFLDLGSPKTKSLDISTQGSLDTSKGVYKPRGMSLNLACLHAMLLSHIL
jgi:hypothetical protein